MDISSKSESSSAELNNCVAERLSASDSSLKLLWPEDPAEPPEPVPGRNSQVLPDERLHDPVAMLLPALPNLSAHPHRGEARAETPPCLTTRTAASCCLSHRDPEEEAALSYR